MHSRKLNGLLLLLSTLVLSTAGAVVNGQNKNAPDPAAGITAVQDSDFYQNGDFPIAQVELGRLLFFDKILSGNRNISCATCHHPQLGTSDGVALSFGEGGIGLGKERRVNPSTPVLTRIPRNAQALYFLGAKEFKRLFHDGRIERDDTLDWASGFWSPAREQLPAGLDNVLAVQAMFPVLAEAEMAGHKGENEIAYAVSVDKLEGPDGAWALLAKRLQNIPQYVGLFKAAFSSVQTTEDISFVHAANAIAAFEATAFRADESPFDHYLRSGDISVLKPAAQRGMGLFYGKAECARCHSGKFQTDQDFHAIAMPQIGPGKNDGWDQSYWQATGFMARLEDHGRYRVTQKRHDRYRFRTPSLRNVALSGPWGHAGSYTSLEAVIRHHLDPVAALEHFQSTSLPPLDSVLERTASGSQLQFRPVNPNRMDDFLRRDEWVMGSAKMRQSLIDSNELKGVSLSDKEVADLLAFLNALTDPRSHDQVDIIPAAVPSGLPVDD